MKRFLLLLAALTACSIPSVAAWTRVRNQVTYCGDSAAACTITVTAPTAGNLLAIAAMYNGSAVTITSATGAGTWTHPTGCQASAAGFQAMDWIYNLSATAATSITVNLSGTATFIDIWYFEYSGTGPFTYNTCAVVNGGTPYTNAPGGSITTTAANGLAIAAVKGDQNFNASTVVSPAPWVTPTTLVNGNEAIAHAVNFAATTTQALFAIASASYTVGSTVAFADATSAAGSRKRVVSFWGPSAGGAAPVVAVSDFMAQIAADQFTAAGGNANNEGNPHGFTFPGFQQSNIQDGNNTVNVNGANNSYDVWGTIYRNADIATTSTNTRVQIRSCTTAWKNANTNVWIINGPYNDWDQDDYVEDFQSPTTLVSNRKVEASGGVSYIPATGYTTHWYFPFPRISIVGGKNGSGFIGGVIVTCEMRLTLDNAAGTDDRANAHFVVDVGADYNPSTTGGGLENTPAIAAGKFKIVGNNWRTVSMTTLTEAQLKANPPAITLTASP